MALRWPAKTTLVYALTWVLFSILLLLSVFLLWTGDQYRIPDPGLRITWQLTKSLIVGLLLLIGLVFLFGKRGGNVLIHFGVGLLMLGQFIFGDQQVEERITLHEGESTRIAYQLDTVELAFFESASEDEDRVIGIDSPILERSARTSKYIEDPALPVDVLVNSWMANHEIEQARGDNPATAGIGLQRKGVEKRKFSAAESEKVNLAAAYITFRDKTTQKEIGTYFFSQFLHDPNVTRRLIPETLKVGDKTYQMHFRFRYSVKPYSIALEDVRRENYYGSMTPRDFSSDVHIVDVDGKAEQSGHIWMNNPMRFRGESFYQSSYAPAEGPGGKETTTLQVVTNAGWLIPYVSCVICGLGMFVHFGDTFTRFAARYDRSKLRQFTKRGFVVACIATVATLIFVAYKAAPPQYSQGAFKWFEAGKLATRHEGRLKPMDTVARNLLVAVSNKSKIKKVENGDKKNAKTVGATEWMLSFVAGVPWTMEADCIRIDSKEVLDTLGLTRREGHRYSYKEVGAKMNEVQALLSKIDPEDPESWTFEQKKLRELSSRFQILQALRIAYQPIVPTVPSEVTEQAKDKFWREMAEAESLVEVLENSQTPAVIPPSTLASEEKGKKADFTSGWQAFGPAYFRAFQAKLDGTDVDRRAINKFDELLRAIAEKDAGRFNSTVREYKALTAELVPASPKMNKVAWEAWYNHFDPVTLCNVLYLAAAVIGLLGFVVFFEH